MTNETRTNAPTRELRKPSSRERFLATHANQTEESVVNYRGSEGEPVRATHIGASLVVMYRPTTWGWTSTPIPASNIEMCMAAGFREFCGDCGGDCDPDPFNHQYNNCPGREKFATLRCPECHNTYYDFAARNIHPDNAMAAVEHEGDAGTEIENPYGATSPEVRLKVEMDRHIARYHSGTAQRLGLQDADMEGRR